MNLLLDTCTFLWLTSSPEKLSATARDLCRDASNTLYLSPVSTWEIILKYRLGKLPMTVAPHIFVPTQRLIHDIEELPLEEADTLHKATLPHHHKDPFDRMLICQALEHGFTILTPDKKIIAYPAATAW